jgi:hypothetical protein
MTVQEIQSLPIDERLMFSFRAGPPGKRYTAGLLCRLINRDLMTTRHALSDLVKRGVIQAEVTRYEPVYYLAENHE